MEIKRQARKPIPPVYTFPQALSHSGHFPCSYLSIAFFVALTVSHDKTQRPAISSQSDETTFAIDLSLHLVTELMT
jgi:hypothetical protein